MSVLTAIFTNARHVSLYVPGIVRRAIEGWRQQKYQPRIAPDKVREVTEADIEPEGAPPPEKPARKGKQDGKQARSTASAASGATSGAAGGEA